MKQIVLKVNDSLPIWFLQETEGNKFDGRELSDEETKQLTGFTYDEVKSFSNVVEEHQLFPMLKKMSLKELEFRSNGDVHAYKFFIEDGKF